MMQLFLNKKVFLLLALLPFSLSCTKNSIHELPHYTISDEIKEYCFFKEGSFWTYQNDTTLEIDSIKIYATADYSGLDSDQLDYRYDVLEMSFVTDQDHLKKGEISAGDYYNKVDEINDTYRVYFVNGRYLTILSPRYPFGFEHIYGENEGLYTNLNLLPDLQLNGRTYKDIYHTQVIDLKENNNKWEFFVAKNYGLIKWTKKTQTTTESYSLVSSLLLR